MMLGFFKKTHTAWWFFCLVGGIVLLLAQSYFSLWFLAYFSLVPMVVNAQRRNVIQAVGGGVLTALPTILYAGFWLSAIEGRSGKEIIIVGFALSLALMWGLIALLVFLLKNIYGHSSMWVIPIAIWGLEIIRSKLFVLAPFMGPFFSLGLTQVSPDNPIFQCSDLIGVSGLSAIVVLGNMVISTVFFLPRAPRFQFFGSFLIAGLMIYGFSGGFEPLAEGSLRVAVAQVNMVEGDRRLDSYRSFEPLKDDYTALSFSGRAKGAEFIAWPEQAVPFALRTYSPATEWLKELATNLDVILLVGGNDHRMDGAGKWQSLNSTFLFLKDVGISQSHNKEFSAPLGSRKIWSPLAKFRKKWGWFGLGAGKEMVMSSSGTTWANPICFEAIFSQPVREAVRMGADFIVISGNDEAFNRGRGPFFSLRLMMGRSVEFRRWVCRSSNCGITGFISPQGELVGMIYPGKKAVSVEGIELHSGQTIYSRWGLYLEAGVALFVGLIFLLVIFENKKQTNSKGKQ